MNGYQLKQRDKIIDPTRMPRRPLTDWEAKFQNFLRTASDNYELSPKQNSSLNEMSGLFAK